MDEQAIEKGNGNSLENVISTALQVPGVKVNRTGFLAEEFQNEPQDRLNQILQVGPVEAGCSQKQLHKLASSLVLKRTAQSSSISFVAGLPGGLAMAATIPADLLQFYAMALRLAQEISYLYGATSLWDGDHIDEEKVQSQLILYCGVMFGVSGASALLKTTSAALSKTLPKTIIGAGLVRGAASKTAVGAAFKIIQKISAALGQKLTVKAFASAAGKAIPVIGGVISGGMTFAFMKPMGMRLVDTLDETCFSYTEAAYKRDMETVYGSATVGDEVAPPSHTEVASLSHEEIVSHLTEYKRLLDDGVLTEAEYNDLKTALLDAAKKL